MMNWEYPSFRGIREREMCRLEYRVKKIDRIKESVRERKKEKKQKWKN